MTFRATKYYFDSECEGQPGVMTMEPDSECAADDTCETYKNNGSVYYSASCITDRLNHTAKVFDGVKFVIIEQYNRTGCRDLTTANALQAIETCEPENPDNKFMMIAALNGDTGAVDVKIFKGDSCKKNSIRESYKVPSSNVSTRDSDHCIIDGKHKFYSSYSLNSASVSSSTSENSSSTSHASSGVAPNASSSGSSSNASDMSYSAVNITSSSGSTFTVDTASENSRISSGAIVCIVVAVLVAVGLLIGGFMWYRRRSKASGDLDKLDGGDYARVPSPVGQKSVDTGTTDFSSSIGFGPQSLASLWDDEIIATSRIPREKVLVQRLINRGGYGEVYFGLYNGQHVAVKMLLLESRKSVKHMNEFLDEVRLMALLDHPRVVRFVGIAWDSLSDFCAVLEYMEGGDLRALLASYETQSHGLGFDRTKVTIALHVAHALTYLHSLDPPVLHRDLKSKNILLTSDLQAKITDFGISRVGADKTMTAGVGTSLWMAPEVMLGQRYDGKADIFSFGAVLSELDLHTLPYAYAKENSDSGRKMPDTAILQMVALGKIRVKFSSDALESMVALGNACVAVDPNERPTAAVVLYRLQKILREDL